MVTNPLFPIDNAEQYVKSFASDLERTESRIRWIAGDGITELAVHEIEQSTSDGLVVKEVVVLSHSSPAFAGVTAESASRLNKWATLSALIPRFGDNPSQLVCKVGVFSQDRKAAEQLYAPLVCTEAAVLGWHAARVARGQFYVDPALSPLNMTDKRPPFDSADFESVLHMTNERGFLGSLVPNHFTVEFPWDFGSVSSLFASDDFQAKAKRRFNYSTEDLQRMSGRTTLLQIGFTAHPLYGNGVFSRLEIPIPINDPSVFRLVDELNRWELSGSDLAPLFGSWCVGDRAPTFMTFIPNQACLPGLLQNLTAWAIVRHNRVRQWIEAMSSIQ